MGRRGQRQDRRLAVGRGRRRGALPGRPQRRPYARHRRQRLQAGAAAVGHRAARQAVGHRQRRRARSASSRRGDRQARGAGRRDLARQSEDRRERVADPVAASRTRRASRGSVGEGGTKIGTTKRGIGPAYEDKVGRRAIRLTDLAEPDTLDDKIARLLAHHNPLRRGLGLAADRRRDHPRGAARRRAEGPALHGRRLGAARRRRAAPASASCSRARRARCSTSITAPIPSSPRRTRWRPTPRPARASGPRAIGYVLGIAKAYTTRVGGGPFPTELHDEIGQLIGERGHEFGINTGRPRRCGWFDAVLVRQTVQTSGIDGIALDQARHPRRVREIKVCTRYKLDGQRIDRLPASQAAQARVEPVYETIEGWSEDDERGALLGRPAGAGDQICAPHRGTDRRAGRAAVDEPRARRHDPGSQSVPGLSDFASAARRDVDALRHGMVLT